MPFSLASYLPFSTIFNGQQHVKIYVLISMKITPTRAPGRPRGFDVDIALNLATQIFWSRGYSDASLDDLTGAMGISRPSLYAAFGDKQTLYLNCIERYRDWVEGAMRAALFDGDEPRASLRRIRTVLAFAWRTILVIAS